MKYLAIVLMFLSLILITWRVVYDLKKDKEAETPKFVQQLDLPPGHSLYYSREKGGWLPVYHFTDIEDTVFLVYIQVVDYVQIYWTKPYAVGYPTRDSAVKIINRHWNDMENDRKSHGQ